MRKKANPECEIRQTSGRHLSLIAPARTNERTKIAISCLTFVSIIANGCAAGQKGYRSPKISPDGKLCAYLVTDGINIGIGPELSGLGGGNTRVEWVSLNNASNKKGLTVSKYTGRPPANNREKEIAFSPDSKFIGVLDRQELSYIDLDASKLIAVSMPAEIVTSFGWAGSDAIMFVGGTEDRREVLRYEVNGRTRRSIALAGSANHKYQGGGESRIQEFWSPNGRFLSFAGDDYKASILNTLDGSIKTVGSGKSGGHHAAWKSDSTGIFVVSGSEQSGAPFEATYVATDTWLIVDHNSWIKKTFGSSQTIWLDPLWTREDGFTIMNSNDRGGVLFNPESKRAIFVGEKLKKQVGCKSPNPYGAYCYPPSIAPTPIPGWIMAISLCHEYLTDYDAERGLLLSNDHDSCPHTMFTTAITNDGKTAVSLGDVGGKITVRDVDLSQARTLEELKKD